MDSLVDRPRTTYLLVDGENIDATLGGSILGRRPRPEERPRWDRLLQFARERWTPAVTGCSSSRSTTSCRCRSCRRCLDRLPAGPAVGRGGEKVVDIAIQRTLEALADRDDDVAAGQQRRRLPRRHRAAARRHPPGGRRRLQRVPQPRVRAARRARAGAARPGVRRRGVHRAAAPGPDHPDRGVRPARLPLRAAARRLSRTAGRGPSSSASSATRLSRRRRRAAAPRCRCT